MLFYLPSYVLHKPKFNKIETEYNNQFDLINFIKENNTRPPKYYFDRFGYIQLYSTEFRFNKNILKKMIDKK